MQLFINICTNKNLYMAVHNNNNCHLSETITLKPETVILYVHYNQYLFIFFIDCCKYNSAAKSISSIMVHCIVTLEQND